MKSAATLRSAPPASYCIRKDGFPSHAWIRNRWVSVPSAKTLSKWMSEYHCETPDGVRCEMDDPNGWFVILGIV